MSEAEKRFEDFIAMLRHGFVKAATEEIGVYYSDEGTSKWEEIYDDDGHVPDILMEINPNGSVRIFDNSKPTTY